MFDVERPADRAMKDVEAISEKLRRIPALDRLPKTLLHQVAMCGYYEDLEKGITRECFLLFLPNPIEGEKDLWKIASVYFSTVAIPF
ncbi:hypothetical protein J437_LFUL008433 [Ladona fulva]|uniref:Uncharacterized protein n=1 Tax=Ladona fulva TaxID=123851 RepID=A0A8K0JV34_LADFU|nr:hypothetical protein J437_LFUL008433 [Ladona fulva]